MLLHILLHIIIWGLLPTYIYVPQVGKIITIVTLLTLMLLPLSVMFCDNYIVIWAISRSHFWATTMLLGPSTLLGLSSYHSIFVVNWLCAYSSIHLPYTVTHAWSGSCHTERT